MTGVGGPDGDGDGGEFVFRLDEHAAVFWKFGAQHFHDAGPWSDRVAGTEAAAAGDESGGEHGVSIGGKTVGFLVFAGGERHVVDVVDGPRVAGIKGEHGIAQDVFVLLPELARDDFGDAFAVELVDGAEHAEDEDVFAAVFGGAADGFDGGGGKGNADVNDLALGVEFFDLIAVVETNATVAE